MLAESFSYHQRALRQYESTIGKNHHRTGDVHVKVAEHYARLGRFNQAKCVQFHTMSSAPEFPLTCFRTHFDEALRIFSDRAIYKPEKARANFKKSMLLEANQKIAEAKAARDESFNAYREIMRSQAQAAEYLTEDDFDDLVAFWSR